MLRWFFFLWDDLVVVGDEGAGGEKSDVFRLLCCLVFDLFILRFKF